MSIVDWVDLPSGSNGININQGSNLSSSRENGEAMTLAARLSNCMREERPNGDFLKKNAGKKARIAGWGLRVVSEMVYEKVQAKGRTVYNEIADEIVEEFKCAPPEFTFEEKNIRRRVYDAINVLMATNIIVKDRKEIRWVGSPTTEKIKELRELKEHHMNLVNKVQIKSNFLKELEEKFVDFKNLMQRNQQACESGNPSSKGFAFPFILVQVDPKATVEVEVSDDMRLVLFDFNQTPFTLHDDAAILKAKRVSQEEHVSHPSTLITDDSSELSHPTCFTWNSEKLNLADTGLQTDWGHSNLFTNL